MARAHRHFVPGQVWHITHRCHKREFLLKFAKDRHRYLQWLYETRKRYGLVVLNYTVTSNHIHLLVYDDAASAPDAIAKSIQLVAGRTGQEFNQRKKRKGAYWEDRYHATVIEDGEHLLRCIVYIDLNMVRAGVVTHPVQWLHGGYNEIQAPRRKCILIDYDALCSLSGYNDYAVFKNAHRKWVDAEVAKAGLKRQPQWSEAIGVGSASFVASVKEQMKAMAIGRSLKSSDGAGSFELREAVTSYNPHFRPEKSDIGQENTLFWDKV
ncbi:MAG: transposase [Pseudomonadota bacterium]